ncbi:MAG: Uncharacterised protein [Prochlorococcus marinus str. MIT 9215]|nr:MAG: Uncharacterised protein [Prochlorococcus marinus str. MIT 9215]
MTSKTFLRSIGMARVLEISELTGSGLCFELLRGWWRLEKLDILVHWPEAP